MHQSERVSSTSGNDKNDTNDSNDNNIDDDSDIDSWPEDSISPNDSKLLSFLAALYILISDHLKTYFLSFLS